jgi:hypothetical protein
MLAMQNIGTGTLKPQDGMFVMYDLHTLLNHEPNFGLRRALAELCKQELFNCPAHRRPLIILADTPTPHPAIKDYCDVIDFLLPDYDEMASVFQFVQGSLQEVSPDDNLHVCGADLQDKIIRNLLGMSSTEASRVLGYAVSSSSGICNEVLDVIAKEKANVIRKVEGLEFIPNEKIPPASDFAGFDAFIPWLQTRGRAYTRHAQEVGQELPRGAVLVGIPGTGKTAIGKAAAKVLGLDLIIMDIGSMFDKFVGGTERKIRTAIQMIDAMPQCLLLVDEIDKVFGGAHENQASDSGVSSRMLSTFLSWLSERDVSNNAANRTFVIVTMNRITGVPPEFLRAGRFDKVWSTDLPNQAQRKQILEIHLRKRGLDPAAYGKALDSISKSATAGFAGAEIEEVVRAGRANAYNTRMTIWENAGCPTPAPTREDVMPTPEELVAAATEIIPLSVLNDEDIKDIREFCRTRTASVSNELPDVAGYVKPVRRISPKRKADDPAINN